MDFISKVVSAAKVALDDFNKPETFKKGDNFEAYIRDHLFVKAKYNMVQRTHDYTTNKDDFVENTKEPDFKFRCIKNGKEFFVEAKYRSNYYNDSIEWCKPFQLKRYKEIDKKTPVYITIGVGYESDDPRDIYFIPLKDIKYTKLFRSFLKKYNVTVDKPLDHRLLI